MENNSEHNGANVEEPEGTSSGQEFAKWVRAEDFYAHPELLDRAQEEQITFRPPEAKIPYVRETVSAEALPLETLTQPSGPEHPVMRSWEAPGTDLQAHLDTLEKPFVEYGGPTYDEYWAIEGLHFPQKVLISNIEPGLPMGTGENRRLVGGVDFQADVNDMPLDDDSTSAIFASAMPMEEKGLRESMRTLEPGGLLFWNSVSLKGLQQAEAVGFKLVKAVFESHPASGPHTEIDPDTGEQIELKGSLSFVLMKAPESRAQ